MTSVSQQIISNSNTSAITKGRAEAEAPKGNSKMDSQAFLNLMCMQLQYQDPTNPMDNSEMLAQEAQFSTLEQMEALTSSFTSFSNAYQANSLMGQMVEITDSNGNVEQGYVEYVNLNEKDGASVFVNGILRPLNQVTKVYPANVAVTDSINQNTSLIKDGVNAIGEGIANLANKIEQYVKKDNIEQAVKEIID